MAYRVLLADDEKYVRIWLKNCIDWAAHGFCIIGEAINGEEALAAIEREQPDLVISDMEMPRLNGNGLMQAARERFPQTFFVVVSGYSEFAYLRGAIQNEAVDYLLKPIKAEELIRVLACVRERLERREAEREEAQSTARARAQLQSEGLALRLLAGLATQADYRTAEEQSAMWRVFVPDCAGMPPAAVREALCALALDAKTPCLAADFADGPVFLLGTARAGLDEAAVAALAERLPAACGACGISGEKPPQELMQACWEAYCVLDGAVQTPPRARVYHAPKAAGERAVSVLQEQRLAAALACGDNEAAQVLIRRVFEQAAQSSRGDGVRSAYFSLLFILLRHGYEAGIGPERLHTTELELFSRAGRVREQEELCGVVERLAQQMAALRQGGDTAGARAAALAKEYMTKHYAHSISLEDIASYAGVSANYLCTLFKQDLNCSVFDFLTQTRIEHAKEMLRHEQVKIYEIALAVGYGEPKYFCRVFKKTTGLSPMEYRQRYTARQA